MVTRRTALNRCALAAASLIMGACACQPRVAVAPKQAAGEPVEATQGTVMITYAWPAGYIFGEWMKVLQSFYAPDALPGIVARAMSVSGDYLYRLTRLLAGDDGPDIFVQPDETLYDWAGDGRLLPLDSFLAADEETDPGDLHETQLAHTRLRGQLWALPWCSECYLEFLNCDLFAANGIELPGQGWTWAEFREMALNLTDPGAPRWGGGSQHHWPTMAAHIWQNGGEVFDGEGRLCLLDQPAAVEAMEFWAALILQDGSLPNPQEWERQDVSFLDGALAMVEYPLGLLGDLLRAVPFKFQVASLPQAKVSTSYMDVASHAISARTPHPEEAWRLLKAMLRPDVLAAWARASHLPVVRKSVNAQRHYVDPDLGIDWDVVEEAVAKARPPDLVPNGTEVVRLLAHMVRVILLGAQTVREALADYVPRVNAALARG